MSEAPVPLHAYSFPPSKPTQFKCLVNPFMVVTTWNHSKKKKPKGNKACRFCWEWWVMVAIPWLITILYFIYVTLLPHLSFLNSGETWRRQFVRIFFIFYFSGEIKGEVRGGRDGSVYIYKYIWYMGITYIFFTLFYFLSLSHEVHLRV